MSFREAGIRLIDCVHKTPAAREIGYPYVAIPQMKNGRIDFTDARLISHDDFVEWTRKAQPQVHDVVLSRRTNPGVTATFGDNVNFALGQNLVLLRSDGTVVEPSFLRWLVVSPAWWAEIEKYNNVGAVFDSLKCADVPRFRLSIPPKPIQSQFAELLGSMDDKIELNRRTNETLEAMAQAIFRDWFVDFGPVRRKLAGVTDPVEIMGVLTPDPARAADLAALFPDMLSSEGPPEGWVCRTADQFLDLAYGKSLPKPERVEGRYPVYGSGGITGSHDKFMVKGPGLIVGRKGTVGSLYWENRGFFPIDTVFYAVPKRGITLEFVWHMLRTFGLEEMNTDAAIPGLNRNNVYRMEFSMPSDAVMQAFSSIAAPLRQLQTLKVDESGTLTETRDYLLPKLMSGEVRLGSSA